MDRPDLPLNAPRVFEVAMRQSSFTKAAIELRVTQAAVSHQVARLEDLLGAALFLRTSQGLVPTDEGRLPLPVLEHGFDAMARVLDRLGGRRDIEVLTVRSRPIRRNRLSTSPAVRRSAMPNSTFIERQV
ncbi:regulatory helix-turn-helix protein, lysR family [Salipiger thiooxidans]|uniref:Regulatory helix-turn-helix protein, lysR family n=1 Tax=Salipiger thiooxidans TaxID=282683 RepID=A0A1G7MCW1_9RHOB|nr:regulatory helix-turn-helix protein, lysR family [Salipiger thiooxidans]